MIEISNTSIENIMIGCRAMILFSQKISFPARVGIIIAATSSLVGACTIHPQPEDISGVTSRQIARQVRCETREAVIDTTLEFLTNPGNRKLDKVNEYSQRIGLEAKQAYIENKESIRSFKPEKLTGSARAVVDLIWRTGIAYNYNLEMTETNNNGASINIVNILPSSTRSIGFGPKLNLERQNTRIFTITDTFGKLVTDVGPRYCDFGYQVENEDIFYPLTGKIGMRPVIREFTLLALFDNLASDLSKNPSVPSGPSQMAEQLEFTTTIDLSITPKIVFSPVGPGFQVADASFTAQAIRKDLHKLTIGLYVPKDTNILLSRRNYFQGLGSSPLGVLASAPARTPGEEGALAIVNQALLLRLFQVRPVLNFN